jgi:ABC-2 type transport system ATP-binding protein
VKKTPAISLKNVSKAYGDFRFGPVDLEVEPGSIVAVVGPNGSGKSTLFEMLMNLDQPDSGEVSLFGLAYPGDEVAIKRRIGYVPEHSVGHDEMSARALGEFVSYWYPTWDQHLYQDLIGRYELDPDKRFDELSKGMQRRLLFALALATGPELLLLDEPAEGVDTFARTQMLDDIERFAASGVHRGAHGDAHDGERTVVFATHILDDLRQVADHVILLGAGDFLGLHKKDALLDGWKNFWVNRMPGGEVPGIVEVDVGMPTRIVTDSPHETVRALSAWNIRIVREAPVDLKKILTHLVHRSKVGRATQG